MLPITAPRIQVFPCIRLPVTVKLVRRELCKVKWSEALFSSAGFDVSIHILAYTMCYFEMEASVRLIISVISAGLLWKSACCNWYIVYFCI